jgi:hypothetical protein
MYDDTYSLVREAIINKYPIIAIYDGHTRGLCPHALGTKKGRAQVLCYQFGGGSNSGINASGSFSNWRCLFVDKLSDVQICPGPWHSGGNHSCPHTCLDQIDVEVGYFSF